jgi:hypothetical protein
MARSTGVRKPTLPKASMGLGSILAQSGVVSNAFGRWPGFALILIALFISFLVSVTAVAIFGMGLVHAADRLVASLSNVIR